MLKLISIKDPHLSLGFLNRIRYDYQRDILAKLDFINNFADEQGHTCDIEQSINKQAYQIPDYIDIIIKIGNMEFDRLRLISNFPIDDTVNFILEPKPTQYPLNMLGYPYAEVGEDAKDYYKPKTFVYSYTSQEIL